MFEESFCLKRFPSKMLEQKCRFQTKMSEQKSWFETKMLGHNYCFQPKMSEHKFLCQSKCLNKSVASNLKSTNVGMFRTNVLLCTFNNKNLGTRARQRTHMERKETKQTSNINGTLMVLTPLFRGPRQKII